MNVQDWFTLGLTHSSRLILSLSYFFFSFLKIFNIFASIVAYVFIVTYWVLHMCYHIFISSSSPFALKIFPKKPIFCFCFMILIPSFVSLRILMIFFFLFSFKSSLLCVVLLPIAFPLWLFWYQFLLLTVFLRCLVLLICFKVSDLKSWGALRLQKRLVLNRFCCGLMWLNSLVVKTLTSPSIGLFP